MMMKFPVAKEAEEETGKADPDGETPVSRAGARKLSGFGGLGLEGIVGKEESAGDGAMAGSPTGEGNSGVMSGDNELGDGAKRGYGNNAGAADILLNVCTCVSDGNDLVEAKEEKKPMKKILKILKTKEKEAILMMKV